MQNFSLTEEIGRGKYSVVYKGRRKKSIEYYAIKSVEKQNKDKVLNEVSRKPILAWIARTLTNCRWWSFKTSITPTSSSFLTGMRHPIIFGWSWSIVPEAICTVCCSRYWNVFRCVDFPRTLSCLRCLYKCLARTLCRDYSNDVHMFSHRVGICILRVCCTPISSPPTYCSMDSEYSNCVTLDFREDWMTSTRTILWFEAAQSLFNCTLASSQAWYSLLYGSGVIQWRWSSLLCIWFVVPGLCAVWIGSWTTTICEYLLQWAGSHDSSSKLSTHRR